MRYWNETCAIARRILIELIRRQRSLICWIIFPISILLVNGLILAEQGRISKAESFSLAAPLTLVGSALFFSCLGGSISTVVAEREQQTLKRLFISPLSGLSYFLGIFLAHSSIGIGQTLLVYGTASFWKAEFKGSLWLSALIILMSMTAYVGAGFLLGTQLARRTEDVNALTAALGVPLLMLGGAFIPAKFFPKILLDLAKYNPIYHMNEALSGITYKGGSFSDIASHFWFLAGFTGLMVLAGWVSYRRTLKIEKVL